MSFLSAGELKTLRSFAEAFLEGPAVIDANQVTQNIDRHLDRVVTKRIQSLKLTLFIVEHVLPRWSLWPFRRSFSNLPAEDRRKLIDKHLLNDKSTGLVRDLARIRALFALGYYGDPRTHASIKFVPVCKRAKYQPDKLKRLGLPRLRVERPPDEADICVIGSGAGGAVAAALLAERGRRVVLFEEGPYVASDGMDHDEAKMTALLYKESGLQTTVDLDMAVLQGKCLGGSTTINNAICFRLDDPGLNQEARPNTLEAWAKLGARIDAPKLADSFGRVEKALQVDDLLKVQDSAVPPIDGENARVLLSGWQAVASQDPSLRLWKSGLFRKNYRRCLGCGHCNFGCPYERKLSMVETYLPRLDAAGGLIVPGFHATEIRTKGSRATSVEGTLRSGESVSVRAKSVVVSCGAIGSSVLLMKSGISRNVGSRFSFNAGTPVFARFPRALNGFDGVQMGAYVDVGESLLESLFYPPMSFAVSMPGWFAKHFARMQAYDRFACAGVLIGTEANGRIKRTGLFRDLVGPIDYTMSRTDLERIKRGIARLAQVYFAAGAEVIIPATFIDRELSAGQHKSYDELLKAIDERVKKPEDLTLSSAHPQGGNPMSDDPGIGVVTSEFRVHGYANLYVCDASVFPTTIHINPQLTIMALADYFVNQGVF